MGGLRPLWKKEEVFFNVFSTKWKGKTPALFTAFHCDAYFQSLNCVTFCSLFSIFVAAGSNSPAHDRRGMKPSYFSLLALKKDL